MNVASCVVLCCAICLLACFASIKKCVIREIITNWGERSEPYRSDVGRKFLCMYVCHGTYGLIAGFYTCGPYQFRVFPTLHNWRHKKKLHKMNPDNESKQERLRIRRDRERQARAQETAEEKEVKLAKRKQQKNSFSQTRSPHDTLCHPSV